MIRHTDPLKISDIFSTSEKYLYRIPKYQREYTWSTKDWSLLFNDIIDNGREYFLGSIITVNVSRGTYGDTRLEVIDGQQRITTLSILLCALYTKLSKYKEQFNDDQNADYINIRRELIYNTRNEEGEIVDKARLTPQVQKDNQNDYFSLLCDAGLLKNHKKKNNAGNRRIYRAYSYFMGAIDSYLNDRISENNISDEEKNNYIINELFHLASLFNSAILVSIEVDTNKDAYMLFESLNNRGVPLSAIDLIKNLLIRVSDEDNKADDCYDDWKKIISYLGDEYSDQERFFRQYYNTYRDELNKDFPITDVKTKYPLGSIATKSTLLDIYSKLIDKNYEEFLNNISVDAKNYALLINNTNEDNYNATLDKPLLNLSRIGGAPSYILLMYLLKNKTDLMIDDNILAEIINFLTKYFVRRNLTDYPNTRNLTKIFMDSVSLIKDKTGSELFNNLISYLKENSSDDESFEKALRGNVYDDNPDATRFILCYYEEKYMNKEKYTNLWSRDKSNKYIWTIEHIFPEGDNIPQDWINMIANGDKALAYDYLDRYVHTFGNLTITGYNQNLSNMSFDKKKNRKDSKNNEIGYKNGLKLNEDVVTENEWTVDKITSRTDKLVKIFLEDFKL